jgi:hypothetical protein
MLGALEGLEHLLAAKLNRSDADPITTYINMTTDGRPERRAWWDTRTGAGSDSLTGQSVPLPGGLGGDSITSSGLLYDIDGDATFLNNNAGEQQWTAMQNRLNATLDAIAAQQADPANRMQQRAGERRLAAVVVAAESDAVVGWGIKPLQTCRDVSRPAAARASGRRFPPG